MNLNQTETTNNYGYWTPCFKNVLRMDHLTCTGHLSFFSLLDRVVHLMREHRNDSHPGSRFDKLLRLQNKAVLNVIPCFLKIQTALQSGQITSDFLINQNWGWCSNWLEFYADYRSHVVNGSLNLCDRDLKLLRQQCCSSNQGSKYNYWSFAAKI